MGRMVGRWHGELQSPQKCWKGKTWESESKRDKLLERSVVDAIKKFVEEICISPKLSNWKNVMSETALNMKTMLF